MIQILYSVITFLVFIGFVIFLIRKHKTKIIEAGRKFLICSKIDQSAESQQNPQPTECQEDDSLRDRHKAGSLRPPSREEEQLVGK